MTKHLINEAVISLMVDRFVTREELCELLNCSDRQARAEIQYLKTLYPIIHTSTRKGYKIACSESEKQLVEDSIRNNKNKALSIFLGSIKLKEFMENLDPDRAKQLSFNLEY